MSTKRRGYLLALSSLLLASLSVSLSVQAADTPEGREEVSTLLTQAKAQAFQLRKDISEMESFSRSKLTGGSHTAKLTDIKWDTIKVAETVSKLNRVRSTASASQQQAIDALNPILMELARNIQATIHHLTENRQNIEWCVQNDVNYRELLTTNLQVATKMADAFADRVK